jgi:glycosyltransferase involved in cell wall biosynthesis
MPETAKEIKVSIIIPCYNHAQFLEETLKSVLNQSYANWECIVVDNGSTDHSKEIALAFSEQDHRFHYAFLEKRGVAAARNFGIAKSTGEYILPLDSDDRISRDYIKKAVIILASEPTVKIVYAEAELFGDASGTWMLPEFSMEGMLKENLIFCSAFFRKTDFNRTGGYNESLNGFEDWDFWLTLLKNGGEVYRIPEVCFFYRIRKSSRNSSLDAEKQKLLRKEIYRNHKELYEKYLDFPDVLFEWYTLKESLRQLKNSKGFKLSEKLLFPLKKIKSLFKH